MQRSHPGGCRRFLRLRPAAGLLAQIGKQNIKAHKKIETVEFPSTVIEATKVFFATVFGWSFTDYGPDYTAFSNQGVDGGFYRSDLTASTEQASALIVFYSSDLEQTYTKIERAGGSIKKPVFSFPGGRRFHCCDPSGHEYAVWSDVAR